MLFLLATTMSLGLALTPLPSNKPDDGPWRALVLEAFSDHAAPLPRADAALDTAAAAVLKADGADVRRALRDAGVVEGLAVPVVADGIAAGGPAARTVSDGLARYIAAQVVPQRPTHFGVAVGPDRVALVFTRRLVEITRRPGSARGAPQAAGRLEGRVLARGYGHPSLAVARPDGQVDTVQVTATDGRIEAHVPLVAGDGEYICELVLEGPRGREVAALMPVTVGEPKPAAKPDLPTVRIRRRSDPDASPEALARRLLQLVNRDRARLSLRPLRRDRRLDGTARAHARAMARAGVAAHVLPGGRDARQRIAGAGITTSRFFENVAMAATVEQAHADLWASPGHRLALIDPLVSHIGLGVVRVRTGGGQILYLVEHLAAR